ncbi:MAG: AAA family ATPase, partial [Vicinamibacteria bacterium]
MPDVATQFVVTKEHRRFSELCDAVRRERYIGVCHGPPGVGKTESARRYANWDELQPELRHSTLTNAPGDAVDMDARTIFYTPKVHNTPRLIDKDVRTLQDRLGWLIEFETAGSNFKLSDVGTSGERLVELLIVDEADRLKTPSLEQLRDHHDRTGIGLILIGMPGLEKQFSHYPQFYSRVGFAHQYRPLGKEELLFVLQRHWHALGEILDPEDFTDAQAIAAIARITRGNFRLLERL